GPDEGRAIHRLHGGVVHEGHVVLGEDARRRVGNGRDPIADGLRHDARTLGERDQLGADARRIERARLPFVPLDYESAPRVTRVPTNRNSFGSLSGASPGTGSAAARAARVPYRRRRPVGTWITAPCSARHVARSTCHVCAAAVTSISRAVAPALRSGCHEL